MQSKLFSRLFLAVICLSFFGKVFAQSDHILWYKQPAEFFEESLVLGNGKQGATIFGGVESDKIYLNDITLWSGEPVNANMNPEAYKNLPAIREALKNENYKLSEELNKKIQGKNSESYSPLGTLEITNLYYSEFDNQVKIYNLMGIELFNQNFNDKITINKSIFADKVLIIQTISNGNSQTTKLIIE